MAREQLDHFPRILGPRSLEILVILIYSILHRGYDPRGLFGTAALTSKQKNIQEIFHFISTNQIKYDFLIVRNIFYKLTIQAKCLSKPKKIA